MDVTDHWRCRLNPCESLIGHPCESPLRLTPATTPLRLTSEATPANHFCDSPIGRCGPKQKESNPATHPWSNTERCPRTSSPRRCWVIIILKPATDLGHYGTEAHQRVAGSIWTRTLLRLRFLFFEGTTLRKLSSRWALARRDLEVRWDGMGLV